MKPMWKIRLDAIDSIDDYKLFIRAYTFTSLPTGPTKRQYAKWKNGTGTVYEFKNKAFKQLLSEVIQLKTQQARRKRK